MSNLRWSLEDLYPGFESQEYIGDFDRFEGLLKEYDEWTQNLPQEEVAALEGFIKREQDLSALASKLASYSHLTLAVDSSHGEAKKAQNQFRQHVGELTQLEVRFITYLKEVKDLEGAIAKSPILKDHEFFLKEQKRKADHMLTEAEEVIISKLRNTGSAAFATMQGDLAANLLIKVDLPDGEKELPLAAVRNLAYSGNPEVRKMAYEREQAAYPAIEEASAAALNAIKGEVITVSEMKGFEDPLDETIEDSRMTRKTLDALLESIEEYLPLFRKYLRRKGEMLGYDNGLPFYELFAPIGEMEKTFSYDEAMNYIMDTFRGFHEPLADFVKMAYEGQWLDVEPRPGKRGGAFCSNLPSIGQSRVMANFDGSFSNMTTLAHELGHAYHGHQLMSESILNTGYPMPVAETASIFNETVILKDALSKASPAEKQSLLETSISDACQVIVDIYSRFLFERELFKRRKTSTLTAQELSDLMLKAQDSAYGEGLDPKVRHPYMWINKPHYYRAGLSYYNFPYAFGLLFAKGLYARYLEKGRDFLPEYDALLKRTGRAEIKDLTKDMGIDIEDPAFFRSSLDLIKADIEEFLSLTEEGK